MSENVENRILEYLKALRNELRDTKTDIQADLRDLKAGLSGIESHQPSSLFDSARQSSRLDELDRRLERVERRLELADREA